MAARSETVPGLPKRQGLLAWKSQPDPVDDQKHIETVPDTFVTLRTLPGWRTLLFDLRRVLANIHPHAEDADYWQAISLQGNHRGPTAGRAANDLGVILAPGEMVAPLIPLWMEQGNRFFHRRITLHLPSSTIILV